jgi:hypothetical protein
MFLRGRIVRGSSASIDNWLGFAIGLCVFVAVATGFDYAGAKDGLAPGVQLLSSLFFALKLLAVAVACGIVLWGAMRAAKGVHGAPDFRDSVLWSACLIGGLVLLVRMIA